METVTKWTEGSPLLMGSVQVVREDGIIQDVTLNSTEMIRDYKMWSSEGCLGASHSRS